MTAIHDQVAPAPPPEPRQRRRWSMFLRCLAVFTVAIVAVAVVLLGTNGWSVNRALDTCYGTDLDEVAELHPVASGALQSVDFKTEEFYGCDWSGKRGGSAVIAEVPSWTDHSVANAALASQGWVKQNSNTFHDSRGEYEAKITVNGTLRFADPHINIRFMFIN